MIYKTRAERTVSGGDSKARYNGQGKLNLGQMEESTSHGKLFFWCKLTCMFYSVKIQEVHIRGISVQNVLRVLEFMSLDHRAKYQQ